MESLFSCSVFGKSGVLIMSVKVLDVQISKFIGEQQTQAYPKKRSNQTLHLRHLPFQSTPLTSPVQQSLWRLPFSSWRDKPRHEYR